MNHNGNTITLTYGTQILKMVQDLMEKTGALDALRRDDTVVIKPNLVASRKDWVGVDTDPRVVEALVKMLKDRGISRITVGDGAGMGNSATKAFSLCGYTEMAKRYGLELIDFEKDRFTKLEVPLAGPFRKLEIARTALECDFLISIPLMKAHFQTLMTCSLKNMKGVMSRSQKTSFHSRGLHKSIVQLATVISPDLILVDGIHGNLTSETGRDPVAIGMMMAGKRPVEIDSLVADILGYAPRDIKHIAYAEDAGLGTTNLEKISVQRLNRPAKEKLFAPPTHYTKRFECRIQAEGACCTCMGNLIFALERLSEQSLLSRDQHFMVGQKTRIPSGNSGTTIAVGQCAAKRVEADIQIYDCPPTARTIFQHVVADIRKPS